MLNFKILTTIFALMAIVCFTACDGADSDKPTACDPATCEMAENATEMTCNDTDQCVVKSCAEAFKVAEDAKSCEAEAPVCTCDPVCGETESCVKGEDDKCECSANEKPATCDPACEEGKTECKCENDACSCVTVTTPANECEGKSAGDECAEGKTCQDENGALVCKDKHVDQPTADDPCKDKEAGADCGDNKACTAGDDGKLVCMDKPVSECKCEDGTACPEGDKAKCAAAPVEDKCAGKSEGDECDANKICQKGEADKLECKDKPTDQTPTEPTQPTEPVQPE